VLKLLALNAEAILAGKSADIALQKKDEVISLRPGALYRLISILLLLVK
jgi:hypothetical protein